MVAGLSAPQSLREWQIFAGAVIVLYVSIIFIFERNIVFAVSTGIFTAFFSILVAAVAVFVWRGIRSTQTQ